ncbi:MAG: sugar nucleotide-binding protein [Vampirovibrionales bacterium]
MPISYPSQERRAVLMITGATGMLGQALIQHLYTLHHSAHLPWQVVAVSRSPRPLWLPESWHWLIGNITDAHWLKPLLATYAPQAIIHTVACVDLVACEADPLMAYHVNTYPVGILSEYSQRTGATLLQISTDHYYQGEDDTRHHEQEDVVLVNEYARTKFLAETLALQAPHSWVIRTNIVGHRHAIEPWCKTPPSSLHPFKIASHQTAVSPSQKPTFLSWLETALRQATPAAPVKLFHDYYTSSVDVHFLARWLIGWTARYTTLSQSLTDHPFISSYTSHTPKNESWNPLKSQFLSELGASCKLFHTMPISSTHQRILNVASRQVSSKLSFGKLYAQMVLGYELETLQTLIEPISIHAIPTQGVQRATSLGLDTSWVEHCFPDMPACPSLLDVIEAFRPEITPIAV